MQLRPRVSMPVKIWLVLLFLGIMLVGAGLGEGLLDILRHIIPASAIDDVTLRFLGKIVQGAVIFLVGAILVVVSVWQLRRSPFGLTLSLAERQPLVDLVYSNPGGLGLPSAVVFSGHMGLLIMLSALRASVGRLVAVPPVGSDSRTISRLVHASYPDVRVISATAENAQLCARLTSGEVLTGASVIEREARSGIAEIFLASEGSTPSPATVWPTNPELASALTNANLIVFGPGSFFTSVLPCLLIPGVRERIAASNATTVLVCNIMTEPGRTDGYTVTDFITRFHEYAGFSPDYTIVNRSYPGANILARYEITGSYPVMVSPEEHLEGSQVVLAEHFAGATVLRIAGSTVIEADVINIINESRLTLDPDRGVASEQTFTVIRHDPEKLARVLRGIIGRARARRMAG
jgi:hypothetical protein